MESLRKTADKPTELKQKLEELEELKKKKESIKSEDQLEAEIEELSKKLATEEDCNEQELIRQMQEKRARKQADDKKPQYFAEKIEELEAEIADLEKAHYRKVKKAAKEKAKPLYDELFKMVNKVIEIEMQLDELDQILKDIRPKHTSKTYFYRVVNPQKHSPFRVNDSSGGYSAYVKARVKKLKKEGLI